MGGLSQRKGLSYLFKAMEGFENHLSLTVVGRLSAKECKPLNNELKKHNYIPICSARKNITIYAVSMMY